MNWIANRLAEPSTRLALGGLVYLITNVLNNPPKTQSDWFALGVAGLTALAGATTKSPGSPDADPKPVVVPQSGPDKGKIQA